MLLKPTVNQEHQKDHSGSPLLRAKQLFRHLFLIGTSLPLLNSFTFNEIDCVTFGPPFLNYSSLVLA